MRRLLVLLVCIGILASSSLSLWASPIRVYTFKKDRVDQKLQGNRGYIQGNIPDLPEKKRNTKRTLIGIDIELPSGEEEVDEQAAEKIPLLKKKKTNAPVKKVSKPKKSSSVKRSLPTVKPVQKETRVEIQEFEEDWIK